MVVLFGPASRLCVCLWVCRLGAVLVGAASCSGPLGAYPGILPAHIFPFKEVPRTSSRQPVLRKAGPWRHAKTAWPSPWADKSALAAAFCPA